MRIISTLGVFGLLLFFNACKSGGEKTAEQLPESVEELLHSRDVYGNAERVIPVIVDENLGSADHREGIVGYAFLRKGTILTTKQTERLQAIILSEKTYSFKTTKRCMFQPYLGFIFEKSGKQAHALFCLTCNEVQFGREGKTGNLEDFDSALSDIAALAKEIFPNDVRIQAYGGH